MPMIASCRWIAQILGDGARGRLFRMVCLVAMPGHGYDCASILMGFGRDVAMFLSASSSAGLIRIDDHGWLGLSGEPACADLNMAGVIGSASPAVVDDYIDSVEERSLDAILFVEDDAPHRRPHEGSHRGWTGTDDGLASGCA